jgi:hypothetical protein
MQVVPSGFRKLEKMRKCRRRIERVASSTHIQLLALR